MQVSVNLPFTTGDGEQGGVTHLSEEALHRRVRRDHIQERREELPEAGRGDAHQEGIATRVETYVVGVTDHVVEDHLLGARLGPLQPESSRHELVLWSNLMIIL